ncbi:uncharacterized protein si:dkey-261o4.8 [Ctenopharyngodon idella]|uniref:uncharacterized protein si:dkey-261o4.8 n=1 Tax=Ctenopharyngodon idella TaxID=7959 RepID=UPI0022314C0A|nr:uncharacterized protein si:dkey-261o4.8 [Ctenopharyngodon idella]
MQKNTYCRAKTKPSLRDDKSTHLKITYKDKSKTVAKKGDSALTGNEMELCDETSVTVTEYSVNPSSSVNEKMTCKDKSRTAEKKDSALTGNEMELCDETSVTMTECSVNPSSSVKEKCHHEVHSAVISSLDSCGDCSGPVSS